MTQAQLIITELAATRKELEQVKTLLLSLTGKSPKKANGKGKSVEEYRAALKKSHLKNQIKK